MRLFCLQLEASCLQWSIFTDSVMTILAFSLTVGAFFLTALAFFLQLELFCLQWVVLQRCLSSLSWLAKGICLSRLVAQALYPPYRAIGYSYTLSLFDFQVYHPIALYPPYRPIFKTNRGVSHVKLPFEGYRAIGGYSSYSVAVSRYTAPLSFPGVEKKVQKATRLGATVLRASERAICL